MKFLRSSRTKLHSVRPGKDPTSSYSKTQELLLLFLGRLQFERDWSSQNFSGHPRTRKLQTEAFRPENFSVRDWERSVTPAASAHTRSLSSTRVNSFGENDIQATRHITSMEIAVIARHGDISKRGTSNECPLLHVISWKRTKMLSVVCCISTT